MWKKHTNWSALTLKRYINYTEVAYSSVTNPRVNAVTCLPRLWMISVFSSFSCISLCWLTFMFIWAFLFSKPCSFIAPFASFSGLGLSGSVFSKNVLKKQTQMRSTIDFCRLFRFLYYVDGFKQSTAITNLTNDMSIPQIRVLVSHKTGCTSRSSHKNEITTVKHSLQRIKPVVFQHLNNVAKKRG
mgnify:CR=1 FL=1